MALFEPFMSYQLPDLLTILNSLAGEDEDGDLHINSSYQAVAEISSTWLLANLRLSEEPLVKKSRLQLTTQEFLNEYNTGLLASLYFPFSSVPKNISSPSALQVATEWLAICALVTEQIARPLRIIDFEVLPSNSGETETVQPVAEWLSQPVWQCILPYLTQFCPSESEKSLQDSIEELLDAHLHPPLKPMPPPRQPSASAPVAKYLEWRATLSGLRVLSTIFFTFEDQVRIQRVLDLVLEIIACVTDIFAYNLHQAWHRRPNNDHSHLNLVAFLLAADPELVLQGAINQVGDMIRERLARLKAELEKLKHSSKAPETSRESGGILASLFSSFLPLPTSSSQDKVGMWADTNSSRDEEEDSLDIRRKLKNWVAGTIHWAYEVEYFFPNFEDEGQRQSGVRRKRGGEIRDYGWIFLIKGEEVGESSG